MPRIWLSSELEKGPLYKLYNDAIYYGQWKEEKIRRQGFGVEVWDGSLIYEGLWADDKRNG